MSFIGNTIKAVLAIAMVAGVLFGGFFLFNYGSSIFGSLGSSNEGKGKPVIFVIKPGESTTLIAENLKKANVLDQGGLINSVDQFKGQLKIKGVEGKIKAGRFELTTGMNMDLLIDTLVNSSGNAGLKFQVIEGKRVEEIAGELSAQNVVSQSRFLELTTKPEGAGVFSNDFLAQSGRPGDQGLEGYLFPDTYTIEYSEGDNSETVIRTMLDQMAVKFTPEMRAAAAARGLTVHQILTVASIVQREGVVADELPRIAAVFWNRIDNDMRLDADPTTQYGVATEGDWWPELRKLGLESLSLVEHPYNTYYVQGLPPGPICNPGELAIRAAVYPEENSPYLYFVAKEDGSRTHEFAETLEEHNRNIAEIQGTVP